MSNNQEEKAKAFYLGADDTLQLVAGVIVGFKGALRVLRTLDSSHKKLSGSNWRTSHNLKGVCDSTQNFSYQPNVKVDSGMQKIFLAKKNWHPGKIPLFLVS